MSSTPTRKRVSGNNVKTLSESGRLSFDERGNAIFTWNRGSNGGKATDTQRLVALDHPALALADEGVPAKTGVFRNELGLKRGYNPYESGTLPDKPAGHKRDMRKLSAWIQLKKKLADSQ